MLQIGMKALALLIPRQVLGISVQGQPRLTCETHIQHPGYVRVQTPMAVPKAFWRLTQYLTLLTIHPSATIPGVLKHPRLRSEGPTRSKANSLRANLWPEHKQLQTYRPRHHSRLRVSLPYKSCLCRNLYAPCGHSPSLYFLSYPLTVPVRDD